MCIFMKMLTRVKIKKVIFHMENMIIVFPFENMLLLWKRNGILNKWNWTALNKSNTLKLNGLGVVRNMKGHYILFISKASYVLVIENLFARFDDQLRKSRLNFCICMQIFYWSEHLMWIILDFNFLLLMRVYVNLKERIVLKKKRISS